MARAITQRDSYREARIQAHTSARAGWRHDMTARHSHVVEVQTPTFMSIGTTAIELRVFKKKKKKKKKTWTKWEKHFWVSQGTVVPCI